MNHYYLIPVTHQTIKHDENTLMEHLSMVDPELHRCVVDRTSKDGLRVFSKETCEKFDEKLLPTNLIIVFNEKGEFYELATHEKIDMTTIDTYCENEVLGIEIADYFYYHPDYVATALHFFDSYYEKKRDKSRKKDDVISYVKKSTCFPRKTNQ